MEQSYKEKYEDILARLERAKNDNEVCDERFCCVINDLFPELAESEEKPNGGIVREDFTQGNGWYKVNLDYLSKAQVEEIEQLVKKWNPKEVSEDEKIKKAILIYLDWLDGKKDYLPKGDYTIKDMILWLERQGEHANFLSKIQVGDKVTRNEYGVLVNLSQLNRVAKAEEKQDEQKFEMKTAEESLGISSDEYNKIVDECIFGEQESAEWHREDEQNLNACLGYIPDEFLRRWLSDVVHVKYDKPAWSEEDEQHIDSLLKRLDALCRNKFERTRFAISEDREWLKSLKDRVQPKQEWSEEDEKIINGLIDSLTRISLNTRTDSTSPNYSFYREIDWLKSIRPQNTWKPSELQLGCLSDAIEHYNSLGYPAPKLKELLDDLKKLKECV